MYCLLNPATNTAVDNCSIQYKADNSIELYRFDNAAYCQSPSLADMKSTYQVVVRNTSSNKVCYVCIGDLLGGEPGPTPTGVCVDSEFANVGQSIQKCTSGTSEYIQLKNFKDAAVCKTQYDWWQEYRLYNACSYDMVLRKRNHEANTNCVLEYVDLYQFTQCMYICYLKNTCLETFNAVVTNEICVGYWMGETAVPATLNLVGRLVQNGVNDGVNDGGWLTGHYTFTKDVTVNCYLKVGCGPEVSNRGDLTAETAKFNAIYIGGIQFVRKAIIDRSGATHYVLEQA